MRWLPRGNVGLLLGALLVLIGVGCQHGRACIELRSDLSLNLYEGAPHATDLYLYPLADALAFQQTSADALLSGIKPAGMTVTEPVKITVLPGQDQTIDQQFPENTLVLGLLADYYRERGDDAGMRTLVVQTRCGRRSPRVYMSVADLKAE